MCSRPVAVEGAGGAVPPGRLRSLVALVGMVASHGGASALRTSLPRSTSPLARAARVAQRQRPTATTAPRGRMAARPTSVQTPRPTRSSRPWSGSAVGRVKRLPVARLARRARACSPRPPVARRRRRVAPGAVARLRRERARVAPGAASRRRTSHRAVVPPAPYCNDVERAARLVARRERKGLTQRLPRSPVLTPSVAVVERVPRPRPPGEGATVRPDRPVVVVARAATASTRDEGATVAMVGS